MLLSLLAVAEPLDKATFLDMAEMLGDTMLDCFLRTFKINVLLAVAVILFVLLMQSFTWYQLRQLRRAVAKLTPTAEDEPETRQAREHGGR